MPLVQRISRNARNVLLVCPRTARIGGRRRGLNLILVTLILFTLTLYITERKPHRSENIQEFQKVERRSDIISNIEDDKEMKLTKLSPPDPLQGIQAIKPALMVTRAIPAAKDPEYEIKKEGAARRLMSVKNCTKHSPLLVGDMKSNPNITPSMDEVIKHVGPDVLHGGCYFPTKCKARQKVAIIIPFKDRDAHLKTLLYYLHPMLVRQRVHYCVYVGEQYDNGQFNKATIMNAAFEEAVKQDKYDCIIFHDVDMIPENDKNFYMCGDQPRHLSPAIDKFEYKPHYGTDFGGVTGITVAQYRKANGHSNRFWGWGGEDNDMEFRIKYRNMSIIPSSLKVGRYKMIQHLHPWKFSPNKSPWKLNNTRKARARSDGLTDLKYRMVDIIKYPLYTKFVIDIRRVEVTKLSLYIDGRYTMDIDLYPDQINTSKCRWETYPNTILEKHDKIDDSNYTYANLTTAKRECENLKSMCGGIVAETGGKLFILQKKGPPKHSDQELMRLLLGKSDIRLFGALGNDLRLAWVKLRKQAATGDFTFNRDGKRQLRTDQHVVLDPEDKLSVNGAYKAPTLKEILRENTTSHIKYCPGFFGSYQRVPLPLKQTLSTDIVQWTKEHDGYPFNHFFAFKYEFQVLLPPTSYMYYTDAKHFESHLEKGENHYTFTWPGSKVPDFSDPKTPKKFSFRTPDFAIPNIPGTYAVESKIIDSHTQPYFQWNWWFEVTSGDLYKDAEVREAYWKKKMKENMLKGRAKQHLAMMKEKATKQKENQAMFEKKMSAIKKKQPRLPMPPKVSDFLEKVNKQYHKKDTEGDPIAEYFDMHDPLFQSDVGQIKISNQADEAVNQPRSSSTTKSTTTTTTPPVHRISTIKSKFHLKPPSKNLNNVAKNT